MPERSSSTFDSLLGLRDLRLGQPGVDFTFTYPLPPWVWAIVVLAIALAAWWSYRRLDGPRWSRLLLAGLRTLLLALLVFLACGPKLSKPNESLERDWVIALIDRSSSMRVADVDVSTGPRQTREDQLRLALTRSGDVWSRLSATRTVLWMGFDAGSFELKRNATTRTGDMPVSPVTLDDPTGRRTDLTQAIEQALARAAARPVSGIVVFSDGKLTDDLPRPLLRRLQGEKIGLYVVPLGSREPMSDLVVRSATGPGVAFVGDVVPVEIELERAGAPDREARAKVELIDTLTGKVLGERQVVWPAGAPDAQRLTLPVAPDSPGSARWQVKLTPETTDLSPDNNTQSITIAMIDRPLRVLYLDGYPRWEYRFIKNVLARERSMEFAAMLLSTGRRYIQEGSLTLDSVPASPGEWDRFDVLVMGDIRPEVFTSEQLNQIRTRVSVGGAGIVWIAGESAVPGAWRSTPLADLLPVALGGSSENIRTFDRDVNIRPTPLADRLGVLRLSNAPSESGSFWPDELSDPTTGWSRLRWMQRLDPAILKPAAEVLALAQPVPEGGTTEPALPAIVSMRFGAGRVLYVATDEIWRWRFGRGEELPEKFWLQLIRLLGRESVARAGRPAILELGPSRAQVAQSVRVNLELQDQALLDAAPGSINVRLTRIGDVPGASSGTDSVETIDLTLRPVGGSAAGRPQQDRRSFSATWLPRQTGRYRAVVTDALLASAGVSAEGEVFLADDELRHPETDHAKLIELARQTGGEELAPADLTRLERILPKREQRLVLAPDEHTLWDSPLALISLVTLLLLEWVGRRLIRLM